MKFRHTSRSGWNVSYSIFLDKQEPWSCKTCNVLMASSPNFRHIAWKWLCISFLCHRTILDFAFWANASLRQKNLPAAQHWCSEKSSQLQSNMCMHLRHFVTVFVIFQINVLDGGHCTRGKVHQISCVCRGLKISIWGKAPICTNFSLKGAGPKFGQDGGMMTASTIWPTTITPHISSCQQVQGLNICTVFVDPWPILWISLSRREKLYIVVHKRSWHCW